MKARARRTAARHHVAAVLAEADRLGPGHHVADELRHLHLQRVRQREGDPVRSWARDRVVDRPVGVAEHQRADTHAAVEVFVAVHVGHAGSPRPARRYLGATPRTYWPGPLASVCVVEGMSPSARA